MCRGFLLYKFSWRIFLGTFSHKNEEKKSREKIREKIRRPKNKIPRKIRSAKNLPLLNSECQQCMRVIMSGGDLGGSQQHLMWKHPLQLQTAIFLGAEHINFCIHLTDRLCLAGQSVPFYPPPPQQWMITKTHCPESFLLNSEKVLRPQNPREWGFFSKNCL